MKKLIILLTGFILFGCASTGSLKKAAVNQNYDKFDDQTVYSTTDARVYGSMATLSTHYIYMKGYAVCPGKQPCSPDNYAITLTSNSDGWTLLNNSELNFIIDGERYHFSEQELSVARDVVYGSNVEERISAGFTKGQFKKLAYSENVEAEVGGYELNMSYDRRKILRLLAQKMGLKK